MSEEEFDEILLEHLDGKPDWYRAYWFDREDVVYRHWVYQMPPSYWVRDLNKTWARVTSIHE